MSDGVIVEPTRRRSDQLWLRVLVVAAVPVLALASVSALWIQARSDEAAAARRAGDVTSLVVQLTDLSAAVHADGGAGLGLLVLPELGLDSLEGFVAVEIEEASQQRAIAVEQLSELAPLLDELVGPGTWDDIVDGLSDADTALRRLALPSADQGQVVFADRTGMVGPLASSEAVASRIEAARDSVVSVVESDAPLIALIDLSTVSDLALRESLIILQDYIDRLVEPGAADDVVELVIRQDERIASIPPVQDPELRRLVDEALYGSGQQRWLDVRSSYLARGEGDPIPVEALISDALAVESRAEPFATAINAIGDSILEDLDATITDVEREVDVLRVGVGSTLALAMVLTGLAVRATRAKARELDDATDRLEAGERYARSVVDNASDAMIVVGSDGTVVGTNTALDETVGIEVKGESAARILPGLDAVDIAALRNVELLLERAGHDPLPVLVSSAENRMPDGTEVVVLFARDISERKSFEAELEHLASHDALTGLPNRASVLHAIHRARRRARRIGSHAGVMFVDLDGFKAVNDTRGHQVGDDLLVEVAARLTAQVRPYDIVGRLGGDEFVVVLDDIGQDELVPLAGRVLQELQRPIDLGEEIRIGASIGLALDDGRRDRDSDELLQEADLAMYRAKRSGRNRIEIFDEDMQVWIRMRSDIENGLRAALPEGGELELHAQPLIDLATGQVRGVEALARWPRDSGPISPGVFVPIAEEAGLAIDLGRWAMREACRMSKRLANEFHDTRLTVSVNVSGQHVAAGLAADDLAAAISESGISPSTLAVELTETQLLHDLEQAVSELSRIRGLGVAISIDDFGTGYSSLTYLSRLPASSVKLDRAFVAELDREGGDTSIIRMILDLAQHRGLITIGEGVETAEQAEELRRLGCNLAQGYLYHPALPLDEVIEVIASQRFTLESARRP